MRTFLGTGSSSHLCGAGAVAALVLASGAQRALADYSVMTQAVAFPNSSYEAHASYNASPYWNPGVVGSYLYTNPDPGRNYDSTATGTVDATGLATSCFDNATAVSNLNFWNNYGVPVGSRTQSAFAAANLATGALQASATGNVALQQGIAYAGFRDVIHYSVPGADPSTITNVNLRFSLAGSVSGPPGDAYYDWNMYFGDASLYVEAADNAATGSVLTILAPYPTASGWASFSYGSVDPANFSFDGVYALHGASGDIAVSGALRVIGANGMTADFSHTALYELGLPQGVSYTSDSGVFLSVPAPASLALVLGGLIGLGRRRRA